MHGVLLRRQVQGNGLSASLDNRTDVRHLQEMPGHTDISTTQYYTKVSIAKLAAVHGATHQAAKLLREQGPDDEAEA